MNRNTLVPCLLVILIASVLFIFRPLQAQEAKPTQPSSDGKMEAALEELKRKGDILSVRLTLKNVSDGEIEPEIRYQEFYFAAVNEKKKYFLLKDSEGKYIAGPQHYDWGGGTFKSRIPAGESRMIWLKFPAPAQDTTVIDLFIPKFMPFEEVEVGQ